MNNSQKGKTFERWDRDGVAQHRNIMHEIAMKKQITMYRREEKILERELREISKVKETLLQIRAPLRRTAREDKLQENLVESSEIERNLRKSPLVTTKINVTPPPGLQRDGTNSKVSQTESGNDGLRPKTIEVSTKALDGKGQSSATLNIRYRKINTLQRGQTKYTALETPGGQKLEQAPGFLAGKASDSEEISRSGFLPVIKTPNPPPDVSPSLRRKSPLLDKPSSTVKTDEHVEYDRTRSPALFTPLAPSRVDAALFRTKSVACEISSHPMIISRGRQRQADSEETTTLTMEETLRIKGKFRQIGHSVIATALLKGLRQKGQLSSEAIHNMHKPISLGEESEVPTTDGDNNTDTDGGEDSNERNEESEESKQGNNKKSFSRITRKTIYMNRMINVKSNKKHRSQSDPGKFIAASNSRNTQPRSVANTAAKSIDKGLAQDSTQSKVVPGNSAGMRRRDSATEFELDPNSTQIDTENVNAHQTQQMFRKQCADVDPFRPLMNPRTAHARRRKNTLSANLRERVKGQVTQIDHETTGLTTVRFATDAWS